MSNPCDAETILETVAVLNTAAGSCMKDRGQALKLLLAAPHLPELAYLRFAVLSLYHLERPQPPKEHVIRSLFFDGLSFYLPGAEQVSLPTVGKNKPDGFVRLNGNLAPVEIKRFAFDAKALLQIERYMSAYDARLGVAVAPKLGCVLPDNIWFVQVVA